MKHRVYTVGVGNQVRLIRASNRRQAIAHVSLGIMTIRVATQEDIINQLDLSESEKSAARIILHTQMYPTDSNGRDRIFEISDILHTLNGQIFEWQNKSEGAMLFGGVILALLELYNINEKDFIDVWQGEREIPAPKAENKARKQSR